MKAPETEVAFSCVVERAEGGWEARIVDARGSVVFQRACADEVEARVFASTVRQHLYWLSPSKVREYYRIPEAVGRG